MESNTVKTDSNALDNDNVTQLPVDRSRDDSNEDEGRPDYLRDVTEQLNKSDSALSADLRAARIRLGEDVETIATALNIRASHLEALERGDISALPGRAYALGFVRSYAGYLGLDPDASVTRFKLETDREEEEAAALAFPEANEDIRMPQGSLMLLGFLMVAAILGGLQLARMVDNMLAPNPTPPAAAVLPAAPASEGEPAVTEGLVLEPVPTTETGTDLVAPIEGDVAATTEPDPQIASTAPAAEVAVEAPAVTPEVTSPAPAAPAADEEAFGADPADSRVSILATGQAWMRLDNPNTGAVLFQGTIRAGERYYVPDLDGIVMAARNSNNLEIYVDGTSLGPAGVGVLVEKSLNPDQLISPAD